MPLCKAVVAPSTFLANSQEIPCPGGNTLIIKNKGNKEGEQFSHSIQTNPAKAYHLLGGNYSIGNIMLITQGSVNVINVFEGCKNKHKPPWQWTVGTNTLWEISVHFLFACRERMLFTCSVGLLISLFHHSASDSLTRKSGKFNNLHRIFSLSVLLLSSFPRQSIDSAVILRIMLTTGKNCKILKSQ